MINSYQRFLHGLFFIIILSTYAIALSPRQLFFEKDKNLWLGTNLGLLKYQTENELLTTIRPEPITDLIIDDDILWLGTGQGLFYADLSYLDWKKHSQETGLPGDSIVRIAADMDYIYVVGKDWLARMDKLVEQWEQLGDFTSQTIRDLYSDQDFLWIATSSGLSVFEKQYEKWKLFTEPDGLISNNLERIFYFNDHLWILTEKGFSRYNLKMQSWNAYKLDSDIPGSAINYLWLDANFIWTITPQGVVRFSAEKQVWETFSKNTPIENFTINALATSGEKYWFATSEGTYTYLSEERRWIPYTAIEGLSDDIQDNIFCIGQEIVSIQGNNFNIYKSSEDLWQSQEIAVGTGDAGQTSQREFFNDQRGLGFIASNGIKLSLLGQTSLNIKNKAEFRDPFLEKMWKYIFSKDLDSVEYAAYNDYLSITPKVKLNLNLDLTQGRTIQCSYNNVDRSLPEDIRYEPEVFDFFKHLESLEYLEYRGYGDDVIRRFGYLKDHKTDYFFSTLVDPTYLEGAGLRAEFGSRVGEKKRRRVNTGVWAGWRKTEYLNKLIPFQENNLYEIMVDKHTKAKNIITESVAMRVDGKLVDPREYTIDRNSGKFFFNNENLITPDSRIEISLEYEPVLGGHTSELAAGENIVVFSDHVSLGLNGMYRGYTDTAIHIPDVTDTKNKLFAGSINSKIELKSDDNKIVFKALPEFSVSQHDSVLVEKQGSAAKVNYQASIHSVSLQGIAEIYTSFYEAPSDNYSILGRINHREEARITWDITSFIPITAGFNFLDAATGKQQIEYFESLFGFSGKPSLKLSALHQKIDADKLPLSIPDSLNQDSILVNRWNGRLETEWNLSEKALDILHINRLRLNGSYAFDYITTDSSTSDTSTSSWTNVSNAGWTLRDNFLSAISFERLNHNLIGEIQISPHQNITLETRQVYRFFQQRDSTLAQWKTQGNRYRSAYTLFTQELIPGIDLQVKFELDHQENTITNDTSASGRQSKLNNSVTIIPGVWWSPLNPLQLKASYTLGTNDSNQTIHDARATTVKNLAESINHSLEINPILDFGQDIHLANWTKYTKQENFDTLNGEMFESLNEIELFFRERKTKFLSEYDFSDEFMRNVTISPDTITVLKEQVINHEFNFNWTERWQSHFRTELPIKLSWKNQEIDSTIVILANDSVIRPETFSTGYRNNINPSVLIDWRREGKFIREWRVKYNTGISLQDGSFFDLNSYTKSWDNKIDMSMKAGRNFLLRMLLNLSYKYAGPTLEGKKYDRFILYDLAMLKLTAFF